MDNSPQHNNTNTTPYHPESRFASPDHFTELTMPAHLNMGRGGYDTTDPGNPKSAMAAEVLKQNATQKKEQEVCAR